MRKLDRQVSLLVRAVLYAFPLLWILFPSQLYAATLTVGPGQTYTKIQDAINDAATGDTIFVEIGTYAENLTFSTSVDNLLLEGEETARTVIDGGGTGTVIDLSSFKNITIQKFTIKNGTTGISMNNAGASGNINITNNIIIDHSTGIQCTSSANINITNNVIDRNGNGISCSNPNNVKIRNNIISNNQTDASFTGIPSNSNGDFNEFFSNSFNGNVTGANDVLDDPLFVDPANNDYHLKSGSPAIDKGDSTLTDLIDGSPSDIGAYGGPDMDVTPFQVSGLKVGAIACALPGCTTTATITLTWNENEAYNIKGYEVFSGTSSGGYGSMPDTPDKTICNSSHVCSHTLTVTSFAPTAPPPTAAGQLIQDQPTFGDSLLKLHWSWAPSVILPDNLAGYHVYYGVTQGVNPNNDAIDSPKDGGNNTSYTLTGLTNGTVYYVIIKAYSAPLFYIAVKAKDDSPTLHTSDFSNEVTAFLPSPKTESTNSSNEVSEMPEPIAPFPDLLDQGRCFIATAAYGSPWEPQVKILRAFRDEYLKPYDWGRRFIAWYYQTSPPWARYLNEHAWLKPAVRAWLMPAVVMAYFFLATTTVEKFLILLLMMLCLTGGMVVMTKAGWSRD